MFGDSQITYGGDDLGDWNNYPQGILQGNACGPTIWVLLSSVIFEVLHIRGFAVQICSSIIRELFKLVGFSYVDDCDLIQAGKTPLEALASMQQLINNWSSIVDVTGGSLCNSKSWWYLIDYVWHRGKWITSDPGIDIDLVATSSEGDTVSLQRLYSQ